MRCPSVGCRVAGISASLDIGVSWKEADHGAWMDRGQNDAGGNDLKLTTWNVNSLTARLQHVLDWTAANPVDVLCLQELKLTDDKFPLDALRAAGFEHCTVFGQKTYNGVAIMSRTPVRDVVK